MTKGIAGHEFKKEIDGIEKRSRERADRNLLPVVYSNTTLFYTVSGKPAPSKIGCRIIRVVISASKKEGRSVG